MAVSIRAIEGMRADFERGLSPKQVAVKYKENPYRISSLARLMGFEFSGFIRDPFAWRLLSITKPRMTVALKGLGLGKKIKSYRVLEVDEKTNKIIIEFN